MYRVEGHAPSGVSFLASMRDTELVSCGLDRAVRLWDVRSTATISTLALSRSPVTYLSVSGDNDDIILTGSADGEVKMWDLRYDRVNPCLLLRGHKNRVTGLILQGNGNLITSSLDGTIRLWDTPSGKCAQTIAAFESYGVDSITLSQSAADTNSFLRFKSSDRSTSSDSDGFHASRKSSQSSWLAAKSTTGKLRIWKCELQC